MKKKSNDYSTAAIKNINYDFLAEDMKAAKAFRKVKFLATES
jgi:hypothetical protein